MIKPKYWFKIGDKVRAISAIKYMNASSHLGKPVLNKLYTIKSLCPCCKEKNYPDCKENPEIAVKELSYYSFRMSDFEPIKVTKLSELIYGNKF